MCRINLAPSSLLPRALLDGSELETQFDVYDDGENQFPSETIWKAQDCKKRRHNPVPSALVRSRSSNPQEEKGVPTEFDINLIKKRSKEIAVKSVPKNKFQFLTQRILQVATWAKNYQYWRASWRELSPTTMHVGWRELTFPLIIPYHTQVTGRILLIPHSHNPIPTTPAYHRNARVSGGKWLPFCQATHNPSTQHLTSR